MRFAGPINRLGCLRAKGWSRRKVSANRWYREDRLPDGASKVRVPGSLVAANGASIDCARPHRHLPYRRAVPGKPLMTLCWPNPVPSPGRAAEPVGQERSGNGTENHSERPPFDADRDNALTASD